MQIRNYGFNNMTDKKLTHNEGEIEEDFGSEEEGRKTAGILEAKRRQLIEDRWVSTYVLAVHLEIESMLEIILNQMLPKPDSFLKGSNMGPTFSQKLVLCDAPRKSWCPITIIM